MPSWRVFLAAELVAASVVVSADQAPSAWFGTWTVNVAKSTFGPNPAFKRATRRIAPTDGSIAIVDDLVRNRGGIVHLEWIGKFDGADYPVQGLETVMTNAYRCADERTCELTQKIDGDVAATSRLMLSADGKTLTAVTSSSGGQAITVYEKQ